MRVSFRSVGVAMLASLVCVALPHALIAVVAGGASFGRIPFLGPVIFDTNVYLQWVGVVLNGDVGAAPLGWFRWPLWVLAQIPGITPAEVWVVSATLSVAAFVWVAWLFARHSLPTRWAVGMTVVAVAFPLLTLALRPAAYSWYLPFALAAMGMMWPLQAALSQRAWKHAVLWSVGAIACASVYPWYGLPVGLWVMGLWIPVCVARQSYRVIALAWTGIAVIVSVGMGIAAPRIASSESFLATWDTMMRNGIAWSHLPVVTNVLLAAIIAALACAVLLWRAEGKGWLVMSGWAAFFGAWFHSVLTGLYTNNDHFRAPAFLLVWIALVVCVSASREGMIAVPRWMRWTAGGVMVTAILVAVSRVTWRIGGDFLQQFHIALWLAVAALAALVWARHIRGQVFVWCVCAWSVMGVASYGVALAAEARATRELQSLQPVITWVRALPVETTVCALPPVADAIATQSGRPVFGAETTAYLRRTHAALSQAFAAVLSHAPEDASWRTTWEAYRAASCHQFGAADQVLGLVVSGRVRQRWSGCAAEQVAAEWRAVQSAATDAPEEAFRAACSVVVEERAGMWRLPEGYQPQSVGSFTVWLAKTP